MKNIIVIIIATFALVNTAYSQSDDQFKATSGITTEVGFSPFASEGPVIQINTLNVRWFFKPDYALRLGLTAHYYSRIEEDITVENFGSYKHNYLSIGLNPGIEKHFAGTDRLSPYIGVELSIGSSNSGRTTKYDTLSPIITNVSGVMIYGESDERKSSSLRTGVGLFAGTDFYISKNLYMGVEFSYGFRYIFPTKSTREIDGKEIDQNESDYSGFTLTSSTEGMIRLGWKF